MFVDSVIILLYFAAVISIGLYKGRGDRSMQGFAIGDRNIPWWAVLASILAAEISAGTFLGTPGEGYGLRNFTYVQLAIGTILARIVVSYRLHQAVLRLSRRLDLPILLVRFGVHHAQRRLGGLSITRALASGTRHLRRGGHPVARLVQIGRRGVKPDAATQEPCAIYVGWPWLLLTAPHLGLHRARRHQGRRLDRSDPSLGDVRRHGVRDLVSAPADSRRLVSCAQFADGAG